MNILQSESTIVINTTNHSIAEIELLKRFLLAMGWIYREIKA